MNDAKKTGKVIIAGAGPGDEELITLKLQKRLAEAEIIITDRLVNPAIISLHANASAPVILTGKEGFNQASYSQQQINDLIISHALEGKTVLRLKGGDVAFFSNVLDELDALVKYQIPFEIIPGITAASGVSAYAGIPLTARNHSQGVHFITFNPSSDISIEKWKVLADTQDTIVFYMASKNLAKLATRLLEADASPGKPIAIIEQATTPYQQVHVSTLQKCIIDFGDKKFSSPSMVIVGDVVSLHKQFNWFTVKNETGTIFKDLK
ncbi:MAG: uroporphyrinogen-III C-methyltransferase [Chitinophagaceae bacterium]|nr:MAG: uroporphyrinogen-III C-methyltransferase [Chitinophagaceae bacterium]